MNTTQLEQPDINTNYFQVQDYQIPTAIGKMSEGIQLLREYVFFKGFNMIQICSTQDELDKGSLSKEEFTQILQLNQQKYVFNKEQIEGIINDAPKSKNDEILYRELNLWIKSAPKPKTKIMYKNQTQFGDLSEEKQITSFKEGHAVQLLRNFFI